MQWLNNVYNTPVILVWLGEHGVRDMPGSVASQSNMLTLLIQKHVACSLSFLTTTLEDLGHNQGEMMSTIGPLIFSWGLPRCAKNCDVCYAG